MDIRLDKLVFVFSRPKVEVHCDIDVEAGEVDARLLFEDFLYEKEEVKEAMEITKLIESMKPKIISLVSQLEKKVDT